MDEDLDSTNLDQLTPEQRVRFVAVMRRVDEIAHELKHVLKTAHPSERSQYSIQERVFGLVLEHMELIESISAPDQLAELVAEREKLVQVQSKAKLADERLQRELNPTPEELEMSNFAEKLATRQGTHFPDFDALYRQRAKLERKINEHRT